MTKPWATMKKILYDGFVKLEAWAVAGVSFDHIIVRASDSVACVLVDVARGRVLLVRQQRPAMIRAGHESGTITELVAGRFDVELGPKALTIKEAEEEAGVRLDPSDVQLLNGGQPMALSAGVLTERAYVALAFISLSNIEGGDDQARGVAEEGESIHREWVDLDDFLAEDTAHEDVRVWGAACHLRALRAEGKLS